MKWKPPKLDRSADQWSDREIEFEQMRANWAKVETENSPLRRFAPIILSAVISFAIAGATIYTETRANGRAELARAEAHKVERASNALQLYFDNPRLFDGALGAHNLNLLRQTTPPDTMEGISRALSDRADAARVRAAHRTASIVTAGTIHAVFNQSALGLDERINWRDVQAAARKARYDELETSPSRAPPAGRSEGLLPLVADVGQEVSVYIQFGPHSYLHALMLADELKAKNWEVHPLVCDMSAWRYEVRYFYPEQKIRADSLSFAVAKDGGIMGGRYPLVELVGEGRSLPNGIVELWLPAFLDDAGWSPPPPNGRDITQTCRPVRRPPGRPSPPPATQTKK